MVASVSAPTDLDQRLDLAQSQINRVLLGKQRQVKLALTALIAGGHLASLAEGRALVRRSFPLETYDPRPSDAWEAAYHRYLSLKA